MRLAQKPELSFGDLLPRKHREPPELDYQQLSMILRMEGDAEHAVATIARMGVERVTAAVDRVHDSCDRTQRHSRQQGT